MTIHNKVDLAYNLINEVYEEIVSGKVPITKKNEQVQGLIRTFGKDHFLKNIELMQKWVKSLEMEEGTGVKTEGQSILDVLSSTAFKNLIHKGYRVLTCRQGTLSVVDTVVYGKGSTPVLTESKELVDIVTKNNAFFEYRKGRIQKINAIKEDVEHLLLDKMVGVFNRVISMAHQCTILVSADYLLEDVSKDSHKIKVNANNEDMERLFFILFNSERYHVDYNGSMQLVFEDETARVEFDKENVSHYVKVIVK